MLDLLVLVLYVARKNIKFPDPVYGGGDMIEEVHYDKATWAPVPRKFEVELAMLDRPWEL